MKTTPAQRILPLMAGLGPIVTAFAAPAAASTGATLTAIASTGDPSPDGNGTFLEFDLGRQALGHVAFEAALTGTTGGIDDDHGAFLRGPGGTIITVLREGDASPDADGTIGPLSADANAGGAVLITTLLTSVSGGGTERALLRDPGTGSVVIARVGDPLPGGAAPIEFLDQSIGDGDHVAFVAQTSFTPTYEVVRVAPDGSVASLAGDGDPAPGGGTLVAQGLVSLRGPAADGTVAAAIGVDSPFATGVFRFDGTGAAVRIVGPFDALPGGGSASGASVLDVADNGDVAALVGVLGGAESLLAIGDGTTLAPVLRDGDPLPGGGEASIVTLPNSSTVRLNATGAAVVRTNVAQPGPTFGPDDVLLHRDAAGGLTEIIRSGAVPPFGGGPVTLIGVADISDGGAILFSAAQEGGGGALALWDGNDVRWLLRVGDEVDLGGGPRTFASADGSALVDDETFVTVLHFTDGTQALVIGSPAIPDDFDAACPLTSGVPVVTTFDGAGHAAASACDPASTDLFFSIEVLTGPATLSVNTCGSTVDTSVAVYDAGESEIACANDCAAGPCSAPDACLEATGLPAGTYFIRVSTDGGSPPAAAPFTVVAAVSGGTGGCCMSDQSCTDLAASACAAAGGLYLGDQSLCATSICFNDDCTNPFPIGEGLTSFSTVGATTDGDDLAPCATGGDGGTTGNDVWYVYEPACTGVLTVSTCEQLGGGADFDTDLVVYEGTDCADLVLLGCNDDDPDHPCGGAGGGFHSTVQVPVEAGASYMLRVGGWNSGDTGTGTLSIICDDAVSACCLPDGTCTETAPASCTAAGGTFVAGVAACAAALCPRPDCPLDVDPDASCQDGAPTNAYASDAGSSAFVSDGFKAAADGAITAVCWRGFHVDFAPTTDCAPGPGDRFSITYRADDGGLPGAVIAGPFIGATTLVPTGASLIGLAEHEFAVAHPAVPVTAGTCYWIEIADDLPNDCIWHWATVADGDGIAFYDDEGDGYDAGDAIAEDLAWCLDVPTVACAAPEDGACCLGGGCVETTVDDCAAMAGTFVTIGSTCASMPCPIPGDLDGDGVVAVSDLVELILAWGPCSPPCPADLDGNGVVEVADLVTLILNWSA